MIAPDESTVDRVAADAGIGDLLGRLKDDTARVARAEFAVRRARIAHKGAFLKQAAIFGTAAFVIAFAALVALIVGLTLSLSALMPVIWATLIVFVLTMAVAGLLGFAAKRQITRMGETA